MQKEYKLLSLSVIAKLKSGGIDNSKTIAALKANGSISEDVILLCDKMYLQQCDQYYGGKVEGSIYILGLFAIYDFKIKVKGTLRHTCSAESQYKRWLVKDELELTLNVTSELEFCKYCSYSL